MPTIVHRLARWAKETPDAPAQRFKKAGSWHTITASQFCDRVYALALFFAERGIKLDDVGAILSYNSAEWVQTELALHLVGAKSAGLYPNSTGKDIHYILGHTEAKVLALQNADYFKKITDGSSDKSGVPSSVKFILVYDGDTSMHPSAVSFGHALEEGFRLAREAHGGKKSHYTAELEQRFLKTMDPKRGAFLIYTSGTTGNPKAVVLSHDNLVFTSDLAIDFLRFKPSPGQMFSFLPLCHIAEKMQNMGVGITLRCCVAYATRFENVSSEIVEIQPTILLSVPRLWEKMVEGVESKVAAGGDSPKAKLARWALAVGARIAEAKFAGRAPSPLDLLKWPIAQKLVIGKVRHAMGLGRVELVASGAAPLPGYVGKWFRSLGIELREIYGMSETTGVICMTQEGVDSLSTVGQPAPGTEFKIAEDGELMSKGRHIFQGYYKDEAATKATLVDGWIHTGDLGVYTAKGLVQIRGRKKEIMKTSGGKMIAPSPIEEKIKAAPVVGQVCLVGDNRKYLSALITLSETALKEAQSKSGAISGEVVVDKEILAEVRKQVDAINSELAGFEQVKRFTVISREFSVADGEMTPTMKMKRSTIENHFRPLIDKMYD